MTATTKTRPIIFSPPLVYKIREGQKTETRRPIRRQPPYTLGYRMFPDLDGPGTARIVGPDYPDDDEDVVKCPYGAPGDGLWVRERWAPNGPVRAHYYADTIVPATGGGSGILDRHVTWRPSIHMPRDLCRLELTVLEVRVERLQSITRAAVIAEGRDSIEQFRKTWDLIYGPPRHRDDGWQRNPWVWVVCFEKAEGY